MKNQTLSGALVAWSGLFCGCLPQDTPAYVNDGRAAVAMAMDSTGDKALWLYDTKLQTATAHRLPREWQLDPSKALGKSQEWEFDSNPEWHLASVRVLAGQVWATWRVPVHNAKMHWWQSISIRFDPVKKEFLPGSSELRLTGWADETVLGSYEGQKCVFLPDKNYGCTVWTFPELKRLGWLQDRPVAAGNLWSLRPSPAGWEIVNPEGKKVGVISSEETKKAHRGGSNEHENALANQIVYARIGQDETVILLAFRVGKDEVSFGVFDTSSGKYLWGEKNYHGWWGTPLVRRGEVWTFHTIWYPRDADLSRQAPVSQPTTTGVREGKLGMALVRYVPGKKEASRAAVQEVVLAYPLYPDSDGFAEFAPAADGSHFLLVANGKPSRLLFIPIRLGITEKDIRVVDLVEKEHLPN